ncbi:DMT family transporter [Aquimarina brevivitae]|uniref:EamA-like transporter family protein n=1 Tax=Aquimarina brevivitae TaxID=323412 RepID=A0A4Q7P0B6_9FLAO|nr:EamA family transporter [Aquimarina brevivitae]RZS93223.1 EamA-like transporter family protein [Aquimarina brevivitae]
MPNVKLQNYFHLHFIVFIWGFTAILGELITIEALPLVWYRMLTATIFIFIYIKLMKIPLQVSKQDFYLLSFAGAVIALHWITFFGAIKASNVSITLSILSSGAFFTSLLEPLFYKRKIIWYEVLFGLIVIGGLYIIFKVEGEYVTGIILAIISAFLSAVFSLINGKLAKRHNPSRISFYELGCGVGLITIYLLITSVLGKTDLGFTKAFFILSASDWMYLMILSIICTAYAFIASVKVMKFLSPYTVMLTINLEPVYGIFLAFLIFGDAEQMSVQFYYGAAIILATVLLNGIFKNAKKLKRAPFKSNYTN